jgi:hypothetical protein
MSIDYLFVWSVFAIVVASVILIFSLYRAVEFGRVLVGGIYKSRAKWTAVFLASTVFLLVDSNGYVPYLSSFDMSNAGFMVTTVALPLFINGNIRAAQASDFFHRDPLHWLTLEKAIIVAALASVAISVAVILYSPGVLSGSSPLWWVNLGYAQYFFLLIVVSTYGAASLIVAARRTQDRTMRRFVRMLGLSLLGLVIYFTVWIPIDYFAPSVGDAISFLGFIMTAYFLYRAVMSLSPLGKVEELESTSHAPGPPSA